MVFILGRGYNSEVVTGWQSVFNIELSRKNQVLGHSIK